MSPEAIEVASVTDWRLETIVTNEQPDGSYVVRLSARGPMDGQEITALVEEAARRGLKAEDVLVKVTLSLPPED